jgi:hypothetical protein
MDGEYDRSNSATGSIIDVLHVSLNPDGTLKSQAVEDAYNPGDPTNGGEFVNVFNEPSALNARTAMAWAEHLPDILPADVLANSEVTGDHWSSRWWANKAAQIVDDFHNNPNLPPTDWDDIPNKPTTFPPTLPIAQSDVTGLLTDLNSKLPLAGGILTGPLTLAGNGTNPLHAVAFQQLAPFATSASPVFTGDPQAPTPPPGDADTSIATTEFVMAAVAASTTGVATWNARTGNVVLNTTDVVSVFPGSVAIPLMDGVGVSGSAVTWSRGDHVHPTDTTRAPIVSPAFTGNPTGVTRAPGDNTISLATTAFVTAGFLALAGGSQSMAGPLNVGVAAIPGLTPATVNTGDIILNGGLSFNVYYGGSSVWKRREAGTGALIHLDYTAPTPSLNFFTVATGAKDSAATLNTMFQVQETNTYVNNRLIVQSGRIVSQSTLATDVSSFTAFNQGNNKGAGFWSNNGQIDFGSMDGGGGIVTYYGGFNSAGSFIATNYLSGNIVLAKSGMQIGEGIGYAWNHYVEAGSNDHIQGHAGGWYDRWASNGGLRSWVGGNVTTMSHDGSGNTEIKGFVRAQNGVYGDANHTALLLSGNRWGILRLVSNGAQFQCDNTTGYLQWVRGGDGLEMFGINTSGQFSTAGFINARGADANGYAFTSSAGGLWLSGSAYFGGGIGTGGDVSAGQLIYCNAGVYGQTGVWANHVNSGGNFGIYPSGNWRFLQFSPEWRLQWSHDQPDFSYWASSRILLQCRNGDGVLINPSGTVGGNGAYWNFSDLRNKENIEPSAVGLTEILQLQPVQFKRVAMVGDEGGTSPDGIVTPPMIRRQEIGFVAQDVLKVIPQAVVNAGFPLPDGSGTLEDTDPTLGLTYDTITAALVNATKELSGQINTLHTRIKALETPTP